MRTETEWLTSWARLLAAFPSLPDDTELGEDGSGIVRDVAKIAGLGPQCSIIEDREALTAGHVRRAIEIIARSAHRDAVDLLAEATEDAEREAHGARYQLKKALAEVQAIEAERQMPDGEVVDKVIRYEAHLNRQLMQTLHELEAMQTRRAGGNAPLVRIDVSGLPERQTR